MFDLRVVAVVGLVLFVVPLIARLRLDLPVAAFDGEYSRSPFPAVHLFQGSTKPAGAQPDFRAVPRPRLRAVPAHPRARVVTVPDHVRAERLDVAVGALRERDPSLSASTTLTRRQRNALLGGIAFIAIGCLVALTWTLILLTAISTALYVLSLSFRIKLFRLSLQASTSVAVSDDDARSLHGNELPIYTVLVPAFREPEVVAKLIESVGQLDYPPEKLQIILLLEEDDDLTVNTALVSPGADRFEIVLVPQSEPRTKPKALNYGLQFARGEMVTIFDAEDRPEPLQLRRALRAMREADPTVACFQAELSYFNPRQNLITRWFAIEYLMWFTQLLPGLSKLNAPVPLGGTSNHFRRSVLEELGGWDPFNVTEDADLGVRLHRNGYRTGVLRSETLEEANSDFVNWIKQRSRWYKGYVQTWIVHMRHPRQLQKDLGWRSFWRFNFFVGGTPFIALVNPVFWALTVAWFVGHPPLIKEIYPSPVFYSAVLCWVIGNFVCVYVLMLCAVQTRRSDLFFAALASPFYWIMMAIAALKAFIQIIFQPSFWEKTAHGLDTAAARPGPRPEPLTARPG